MDEYGLTVFMSSRSMSKKVNIKEGIYESKKEQGRIHGIRCSETPLKEGKSKGVTDRLTDRRTDGRTDPLLEVLRST